MRLPELDEEVVQPQPLPENTFSNGLPNPGTRAGIGGVEMNRNRDSSQISVFECDSSECRSDPVDTP